MTDRTLGAQISHFLKMHGVEVIFGIPGVHNQELYRGIQETGIVHILARHEQGVGFMADGYARASGKPGIAFVITGPGLCNIMTPMGQAYSDSVPLWLYLPALMKRLSAEGSCTKCWIKKEPPGPSVNGHRQQKTIKRLMGCWRDSFRSLFQSAIVPSIYRYQFRYSKVKRHSSNLKVLQPFPRCKIKLLFQILRSDFQGQKGLFLYLEAVL